MSAHLTTEQVVALLVADGYDADAISALVGPYGAQDADVDGVRSLLRRPVAQLVAAALALVPGAPVEVVSGGGSSRVLVAGSERLWVLGTATSGEYVVVASSGDHLFSQTVRREADVTERIVAWARRRREEVGR